jgi:hypothetical protein
MMVKVKFVAWSRSGFSPAAGQKNDRSNLILFVLVLDLVLIL